MNVMGWIRLGLRLSDLNSGTMVGVTVSGVEVAIAKVGDQVYAFQDVCPHMESTLSDGELYGYEVYCPLHQSGFDVRTGQVCNLPARRNLTTYMARTDGDTIWVDLTEIDSQGSARK